MATEAYDEYVARLQNIHEWERESVISIRSIAGSLEELAGEVLDLKRRLEILDNQAAPKGAL